MEQIVHSLRCTDAVIFQRPSQRTEPRHEGLQINVPRTVVFLVTQLDYCERRAQNLTLLIYHQTKRAAIITLRKAQTR